MFPPKAKAPNKFLFAYTENGHFGHLVDPDTGKTFCGKTPAAPGAEHREYWRVSCHRCSTRHSPLTTDLVNGYED